jgi:hypothetical protein
VCNLNNEAAQKKLLGEKNLNFQRAIETATQYELIEENAKVMKQGDTQY